MSLAHIVALGLVPIAILGASILGVLSRRGRDAIFVAMVVGLLLSERLDVNFFGEPWYRGTTRGILVSVFEILALGLIIGCRFGRKDEHRQWYWPASLGFLVLYAFYALLSVLTATPWLFGAFELSKIFGGILVFLASAAYIRGRREWQILIVALACAVGAEGIWAVKQKIFMHIDRAAGTLDHPNSLSTYFCMATPVLIAAVFAEWPKWMRWLCGGAALAAGLGEILTFSRLGVPLFLLVSLATVLMAGRLRITRASVTISLFVIVTLLVVIGASWNVIATRYREASLQEEYLDTNVDGRGVYLRIAYRMVKDHPFGVGLNNWSWYATAKYGPDIGYKFTDYGWLLGVYGKDKEVFGNSYLAAPAHNLLALTFGELGYPGLILFGLVWLRWFSLALPFLRDRRGDPRRALAIGLFFGLAGVFGHCVTEWVFRQTVINFTCLILVGALAALSRDRKVEKELEKEAAQWRTYLRGQKQALQRPGRLMPAGV